MGRATDFHASSKGRAKQFGACHLGGGGGGGGVIIFYAKLLGSRSQSRILLKSQSFFCKYYIEHIVYLMTVKY